MHPKRTGPVLVVDDHPVNRLLLESVLELEGIDVLGAGSIAEAERLLERSVPPVIVLDLQLPDGYGLDLVRRLRADPRTSGCAIVACSAGDQEDVQAREAGCAAFVSKPIDTRRFAVLVRCLIVSGTPRPATTGPEPAPHARAAAFRAATVPAQRP
jgi:two-component system CheB/CheR fusion protein